MLRRRSAGQHVSEADICAKSAAISREQPIVKTHYMNIVPGEATVPAVQAVGRGSVISKDVMPNNKYLGVGRQWYIQAQANMPTREKFDLSS